MNRYGLTAIKAISLVEKGFSPVEAWKNSANEMFGNSTTATKCCPKNAFLGLCEDGFVEDVPKGDYTKSIKNKDYAIRAIKILKSNTIKNYSSKGLWEEVVQEPKRHNSQMDVVIALWENGYIKY